MKAYVLGIFLTSWMLAGALPAAAGVVNKGNDAVQVEFEKANGLSESATLFPDQSVQTPRGTRTVRVAPRGSGARGDEIIKVLVVESSGKEGLLTKYNQVYRLGIVEDAETPVVLKDGRVINRSNIVVTITLRKRDGLESRSLLYLDQTKTFSSDIYEVEVMNLSRLRGDERVRIEVLMPDGVSHLITSLGGVARILPENEAALNGQ